MASDDLTKDLPNKDEDKITQPTLTALLALVREVKDTVDLLGTEVTGLRADVARLSVRLGEVESRLSREIAGLGYKIDILNKSWLQSEADCASLSDRMSKLESKIA